jgi:hypothetical protein
MIQGCPKASIRTVSGPMILSVSPDNRSSLSSYKKSRTLAGTAFFVSWGN